MSSKRNSRHSRTKSNSAKKKQIIAWVFIAVAVIAITALKLSESDFSAIKAKLSPSSQLQTQDFPKDIGVSSGVKLKSLNSKLCVFSAASFSVYNPSNAEKEFEFVHGYSNPVADSAENYKQKMMLRKTRIIYY